MAAFGLSGYDTKTRTRCPCPITKRFSSTNYDPSAMHGHIFSNNKSNQRNLLKSKLSPKYVGEPIISFSFPWMFLEI
jgi:hypothetical protein